MSNLITTNAIENALIKGDLAGLSSEQRLSYLKQVCDSVGLNMLTKPFEYIPLNGKLILYATRAATDQLRSVQKVSIKITAREKFDDIYIVTAQATNAEGRFDESTGAVNVAGLKGEALANAYLKAETKAKRRVTLSLCGLGLLDESEVETITDAKPFVEPNQIQEKPVNVAVAIENSKIEFKDKGYDFDSYVIQLGKSKMTGTKLNDHSIDWIQSAIDSTIKWHKDNNRTYHKNTAEFIEIATAYTDSKLNTPEEIPF